MGVQSPKAWNGTPTDKGLPDYHTKHDAYVTTDQNVSSSIGRCVMQISVVFLNIGFILNLHDRY